MDSKELDAAISGLQLMLYQYSDKNAWEGYQRYLRGGIAAITALRAQLADVLADLTFMTENRNKWQDSATQRWFRIEEANDRAVTLIAVPSVTYDTDRSHTAPRQPIIRSAAPRRSPAGVALTAAAQRRVEWVRQALHDIAEGEA